MFDNLVELSRLNDFVFNKVMAIVNGEASNEQNEYFRIVGEKISSQLDFALDECSNGMVPDYQGIYSSKSQICGIKYHHIFLKVVTHNGKDLADLESKMKIQSQMHTKAQMKNLKKFNLLFG